MGCSPLYSRTYRGVHHFTPKVVGPKCGGVYHLLIKFAISHDQVCELMEQQKVFSREMLLQQGSNFKACASTMTESTNSRVDTILKDLQELKISLQCTQREVDDLKAFSKTMSSNFKSTQDDIHMLAESVTMTDSEIEALESQARL